MARLNGNPGFISLLFSIADNPLRLWSKYASSNGRVRRIEDETLNGDKVIEIRETEINAISTNISCPANPQDCLNIQLPILVLIVKNLKLPMKIIFQLIDEENIRRKFILSTHDVDGKGTKVEYNTARLLLKLVEDWNNLEIDLRNLCQSIYRTDYRALQRLIIHPNCRIRRIYLQDRHYEPNETPVQLCQAFFDMYMLKWGIHFVERSCQTNITYTNTNNDDSLEILSRSKRNHKTSSAVRLSDLKLQVHSQDINSERLKNVPPVDDVNVLEKNKISRAERPKRKKIIEEQKTVVGEIVSIPVNTDNCENNKNTCEGEIFRRWPYNYQCVHQADQGAGSKLRPVGLMKKSPRTIPVIPGMKIPAIVNSLQKNPSISPVEVPVPVEVETAAVAEMTNIVKTTPSKLLTTDEAVANFLEIRHGLNRKMLEYFRCHGLTMTEVELSIYNAKNRRNSYGQGKLVEKHRTRIDKACCAVPVNVRPKTRQKSAIV